MNILLTLGFTGTGMFIGEVPFIREHLSHYVPGKDLGKRFLALYNATSFFKSFIYTG